jgi:DNA-binding transcriptional regulator YiaG
MEITLDEITPELMQELSAEVEEQKLSALTQYEVRSLGDELDVAVTYASQVLARCQLRAIRLDNLGVEVPEIANMFDMPVRTVRKWLRSPVRVELEGVQA